MNPKLIQPWLPIERIEAFIQFEPAFVILGLGLISLFVYKLFLKKVTEPRHKLLRTLFKNLSFHIIFFSLFFIAFGLLQQHAGSIRPLHRIIPYVGLIAIFSGATLFVKTCRILALEYLFFRHQRSGVPILLIDFFTLFLWVILAGWIVSDVFNLKVGPILATSAVFSLVLGLAMQDTLGNLLAGIALQIDKPYEIGDWVEVHNGGQKWVGQIHEISWRATILLAFTEEFLTIPNRMMAQAEISNFSGKIRPFIRGTYFRFPYGAPIEKAKELLMQATRGEPDVCSNPRPLIFVTEAAESWVTVRLVYYVENYATYLIAGDKVILACLKKLKEAGIELAAPRLELTEKKPQTPETRNQRTGC